LNFSSMITQKFIRQNLYRRSLLSYLLYPFSVIFAAIQLLRRKIYSLIPALSYKGFCGIISVGNIVSGGSGKTPFTVFLAEYLTKKGKLVAVSHRDYKGNFETTNKLISERNGIFSYAEYAGDEAYLLARKLPGVPVIAGKNRKKSLQLLMEEFPDLDHVILDDSFQHLKVKHEIDFVIINEVGGLGNGFVLPAGILREPVSTLKKANYIVYIGKNKIPEYLNKYSDRLLQGDYRIKGFYDVEENRMDINELGKYKIALLSGIGNPESFENTFRKTGLNFVSHFKFTDHFNYKTSDLAKIKLKIKQQFINMIVTTEKDFVKIKKLEGIDFPLAVLEIEFFCLDTSFLDDL
jgi:tetraacyldisaccharide 4'-kinase